MLILNKKNVLGVSSLLLIAGIFVGGFFLGKGAIDSSSSVALANKALPDYVLEEDFDESDFKVFWDVWKLIDDKYPNGTEVEFQDRVYSATKGLVDSLDDNYSSFFDPVESEYFNQNLAGEFGGVGMEVGIREGNITVISPLKDSPAQKAGILAGDYIIAVDGDSIAEMTIDEAVKIIRGEVGTEITLTIFREGDEGTKDIKIIRDIIEVPTIETEIKDGVFIISLFSFSETSPKLFRDSLQDFIDSKTEYLILDLRGNPGGFLNAAQDMASWFLPEGKVVVIEKYADGEDVIHRSKGYDVFNDNLKLVVLVNGGSASASEILAGALQDHDIATVVGSQTFGKGSVQELIPVRGGGSLKITVAKWLTPDGLSISDSGLTPDVEVEVTKEDIEADLDPQLAKAIETVKDLEK
jgi:carboxyl-terminal processing protease